MSAVAQTTAPVPAAAAVAPTNRLWQWTGACAGARRYRHSLVARPPAFPAPLKSAAPASRNAGASGFAGIATAQHTAAIARRRKLARSTRLDEPPKRNDPAASEPASAPDAATPERATAKPA